MKAGMGSKEIVYRAIEKTGPTRLPVCYFNRDFDSSDTYAVTYKPAANFAMEDPRRSEWGYVWEVLDGTMGQPRSYPLLDWGNIVAYVPPDHCAPGRLEHVDSEVKPYGDKFIKFLMGITGFNQATFLRSLEEFLSDLYVEPDRAERVLDMVFSFENGIIDQVIKLPVDCVVFADDWGTQNGLIMSPVKWREIFKLRYASQFERIHGAGKKVWFHSCGDIRDIIGDLIDIGVDVLEFLQPDVFGIDYLAREFGGKVCFCCSVDHQRRAISGTRKEIFDYARLLNERLGCFNGGLIAYIEDYSCLGMSQQNYQWVREAFHSLNDETTWAVN